MAMNSNDSRKTRTIEEALTLIESGSKSLSENRNVSDVVLVIGNTGAGKSTISKLLVHPEELESYKPSERYLVRDTGNKISGGEDTTVSKTIVPEMLFDQDTNTAIYDLPGFCDTRSEAVEIANAVFMKRVADQAKRVKLLFVISHSSVLSGENRTDLKVFLENSVDLIKNPKKFAPAIGLVVTKVRGVHPDEVVQGVVNFLTLAKRNLSRTKSHESKLTAIGEILSAILTQDPSGVCNRIAYLSEPNEPGPLTSLKSVIQERHNILALLQQNLSYCPSTPEEFGLSVSPSAQVLILEIGERLQTKIGLIAEDISRKLKTSFTATVENIPFVDLGTQVNILDEFNAKTDLLQESKNISRKNFLQRFLDTASSLKINDSLAPETAELHQIQDDLLFLEDFSGYKFPVRKIEWTVSVQFSFTSMKKALADRITVFREEVADQLRQLIKSIHKSLDEKIGACKEDVQGKTKSLAHFTDKSVQLNVALSRAQSVNEFVQKVQSGMEALDSEIVTSNLVHLADDLVFKTVFLDVWQWRKPFEDLEGHLREQSKLHALQSKNKEEIANFKKKSEKEALQQNIRIKQMENEQKRKAEEHDAKLKLEQEKMQKKIDAVQGDFTRQQEMHKADLDLQRKILKLSLDQMQSISENEIATVKQKSADYAREQEKRMQAMEDAYKRRSTELEHKLRTEREALQRTITDVQNAQREQHRMHAIELEQQKAEWKRKEEIERLRKEQEALIQKQQRSNQMQQVRWVFASGRGYPEHGVVGGRDRGRPVFVARACHDGALVPGKIIQSHDFACIPYASNEIGKRAYEILVDPHSCVSWVSSSNGRVPANAVIGGHEVNGEKYYVGRARYDDTVTTGKVHPSHLCCYIPYNGKEIKFNTYEVLTYDE